MNLNAYDVVQDESKSDGYISSIYKKLYVNNIGYYEFSTFLTKYNTSNNTTDLYIALLNKRHPTAKCYNNQGTSKRLSIPLDNIWTQFGFDKAIKNNTNPVSVDVVERQDDGIIISISLF